MATAPQAHNQPASGNQEPRPVDHGTSRQLLALGFDPGIPVFNNTDIDFNLDDLRRALFESDYSNPVTLRLPAGEKTDSPHVDSFLEVISVHASYEIYERELDDVGFNRFDYPNYYVRGFLYNGADDRRTIVIHMLLLACGRNDFDIAVVQAVARPSGADPSTPFVYGHGTPLRLDEP
jgi:hypothetical protein